MGPTIGWMIAGFILGALVGGGPILIGTVRVCLPFTGDFADIGRIFLFLVGIILSVVCGIVGGALGAGAVFVYTRNGVPGLGRCAVAVLCAAVLLTAAYGAYQWRRRQRLNVTPPLVTCIHNRDLGGVRALLQSGQAANSADGKGQTALDWAVRTDQTAVVELLLQNGADVHVPHNAGALAHTVARRNPQVARLLLEAGVDPNGPARAGRPALFLAVDNGGTAIVRLLLAHGADPNAVAYGQTMLAHARRQGHAEIAEILRAAGARD